MKLACWLATLGIALAATSCSINHRSGDFACQTQADCSSDRTCVDSFCVLSSSPIDAGLSDGSLVPGDGGPLCPPQCTSCDLGQNSCLIDCSVNPDICNQPIACPKGFDCNIQCSQDSSCSNVDCTQAGSCTLTCSGRQSCGDVMCGSGSCAITCSGRQSCGDIECGSGKCNTQCNAAGSCNVANCNDSCACDINCRMATACTDTTCRSQQCTIAFGCTSLRTGCNTCQ